MRVIVEAIEDIRSFSSRKQLRAAKGRKGEVTDWYTERFGIGPDCKEKTYIPVMLTGNKVWRELPNWKLKRIEG